MVSRHQLWMRQSGVKILKHTFGTVLGLMGHGLMLCMRIPYGNSRQSHTGDKGGLVAKETHLTILHLTNHGQVVLACCTEWQTLTEHLVFVCKPILKENLPSSRRRNCWHNSCIQLYLIHLMNVHSFILSCHQSACKIKAAGTSIGTGANQLASSQVAFLTASFILLRKQGNLLHSRQPVKPAQQPRHTGEGQLASSLVTFLTASFILLRTQGNLLHLRQPVKPAQQPRHTGKGQLVSSQITFLTASLILLRKHGNCSIHDSL